MSSRLDALAARRKDLIARTDRQREELAGMFGAIGNRLGVVEAVVAGARQLHRHRFLAGAAGVFVLLAPVAARTWLRRAFWLVPLAIEGYRLAKSSRASRRASTPANGD